jgi:hypothetical protein
MQSRLRRKHSRCGRAGRGNGTRSERGSRYGSVCGAEGILTRRAVPLRGTKFGYAFPRVALARGLARCTRGHRPWPLRGGPAWAAGTAWVQSAEDFCFSQSSHTETWRQPEPSDTHTYPAARSASMRTRGESLAGSRSVTLCASSRFCRGYSITCRVRATAESDTAARASTHARPANTVV